jgi:3-phosphoshikimate 1-carboxyvinyltransferase
MASGLAALGVEVVPRPDGIRIRGGRPAGGAVDSHGYHRIAMSFAIAALTGIAGTVRIDDPACAAVSYPGFWDDLASLVA